MRTLRSLEKYGIDRCQAVTQEKKPCMDGKCVASRIADDLILLSMPSLRELAISCTYSYGAKMNFRPCRQ